MEPKDNKKLDELNPDKLLRPFTRTSLLASLLTAVIIHGVVLGVLGVPTLRGWVDPEYAEQREEARKQRESGLPAAEAPAEEQSPEGQAESEGEAQTEGQAQGEGQGQGAGAAEAQAGPAADDQGVPEDRKNTPVYQEITEKADPDEIPTDPFESMDVEDTN
jgi:hypothetical protein